MGGDPNGGMTGSDDLARLAGPQSDVADLASHVLRLQEDVQTTQRRFELMADAMRNACGVILDEVERQTGRRT